MYSSAPRWIAHESRFQELRHRSPPRVAALKHSKEVEKKKKGKMEKTSKVKNPETPARTVGLSSMSTLERKKKKKASGSGGTKKRHRASNAWFSLYHLKLRGDSEDAIEEGEVPISVEPIAAIALSPAPMIAPSAIPAAALKVPHVECSALEVESDDEAEVMMDIDVIESYALPKHR